MLPKTIILEVKGDWKQVRRACMTTVGKESSDLEPSVPWKKRILLAEHSPIRKITVCWSWPEIPYAISTHFARHHVGCTPWVRTSRSDRTGVDRASRSQMDMVSVEMEANYQSIIDISRKRLCFCADPITRDYWTSLLLEIRKFDPCLFWVCVPECFRRGGCPEFANCGFFNKQNISTTSITDRYNKYEEIRNCEKIYTV